MARRAAASTLMRRFLSTTTPPPRIHRPFVCPARSCSGGGESELMSKPPYNMISYLGDWRLTEEAMKHPGMDYKHWFVQMSKPKYIVEGTIDTNYQIFGCFFTTLRRVLPDTLSRQEIEDKFYKVEFGPEIIGFGCEIDWLTKDKLEGELVVNGKIVKRSEREPMLRDEEVVDEKNG
ncbi:hypothetical protein C2S51_021606 [Perilla frutescens var. frutescens]|nr:hypothetical protein C2S51_021606 [Perilla frutescens var. frutescens]